MKISNATVKRFMKEHKLRNISSLSAAQYKKLMLMERSSGSSNSFHFSCDVEQTDYGYKICFIGKHLSLNRLNALSRKESIMYKSAFKKAQNEYWLIKGKRAKHKTLEKVTLEYVFYNPKSRDRDNNISIKFVQDVIVRLKLISDDTRDVIIRPHTEREIISKDYKIEVLVTSAKDMKCDQ